MQHLFSRWRSVLGRLSTASHLFILCDYDGTLTPIVQRPELAVLSPDVKDLLRRLSTHVRYIVAVVTGRSLADILERVSVPGLIYVGNHGLEIQGPGIHFLHPVAEQVRPVLVELQKVLARELANIPGAIAESKGLTLSVHHRMVVESQVPQLRAIFEQAVGLLRRQGRIRTSEGKRILEVRPAVDWDKGRAVAFILDQYAQQSTRGLALYLGDDRTDEDAFQVVNQRRGISVFVGEEDANTLASYLLRSPAEVQELLARLAALPPTPSSSPPF